MKSALNKNMLIFTVMLMDLLTGMEFDLFVPSFPQLQHHFGLSAAWVEALLSVNFIGACISLFFVGGLADRYGRKPIIVLGLTTFVIGSLFCLGTGSFALILLGRFLQGIGITAPAVLSFLIIADMYSLKEQQFLMSMLNGSLNLAAAIAPVLGSYITLYFNWQGNFAALLALGLLALGMTLFFIPAHNPPQKNDILSLQGYIPIFKSWPLMLLIVTMALVSAPYWIFVGLSPLLYMKEWGVSLAHFGYYQGSLAFIFALGSVAFGLLIKHMYYQQKTILYIGWQILMISLLIMLVITILNTTNPLLATLTFIPFIIGQIIPSSILYPLCFNFMPHAKGRVAALVQGMRLIISALVLQIAGYFYEGSFRQLGIIIVILIFIAAMSLLLVIRHPELGRE